MPWLAALAHATDVPNGLVSTKDGPREGGGNSTRRPTSAVYCNGSCESTTD